MSDEVKHTLNLDVVLNPIDKAANTYKQNDPKTGTNQFGKVPGAEVKYDAMRSRIKELQDKPGGLDINGLNEVKKLYHSMINLLISVAKQTGGAAEEVIKATEELKKAQEALDNNDKRYSRSQKLGGKISLGGKAATYNDVGFKKDGNTYGLKSALQQNLLNSSNIGDAKFTQKYLDDYVEGLNLPKNGRKKVNSYERLQEAAGAENADPKYQEALDKISEAQKNLATQIEKEITLRQQLTSALATQETNLEIKEAQNPSAANETITNLTKAGLEGDKKVGETKEAIKDIEHGNDALAGSADKTTKKLNEQKSSLGKVVKQFSIYAAVLRAVRAALKEASQTITQLDKSLTEQAMVTGMTRKQSYALLSTYQDLARQLGTTTKEVAESASEYMKQGKSINDTLVLTRAAISSAKVAGISAADSINYLTTALNGFKLNADDAMKVSDRFASVAASSATGYDELAIALSKVASQANLAGMSIDYTTALLATGLETTREAPETMGTALKTIIARMREIKDYGATLSDSVDISNVETQLDYVNIKLRDSSGELRSTQDVLDELGKKWNDLNKNQQAAIAKALAGTRQQSRLIAMMDNYDRVIELQQISMESAGATAAQMDKYLKGMEAATNNVRVAWEKIVTAVADSDVLIGLVNGAANILNSISGILQNDAITITGLVLIAGTLLTTAIQRYEIQKAHNRAILEENKATVEDQILHKTLYLQLLKEYQNRLRVKDVEQKITKEKAEQGLLDGDAANDAKSAEVLAEKRFEESVKNLSDKEQEKAVAAEIAKTEGEITGLEIERFSIGTQIAQNQAGIRGVLGQYLGLLSPVLALLSTINGIHVANLAIKKAENAATAKGTVLKEADNAVEKKGLFIKGKAMAASMIGTAKTVPGAIAMVAMAAGVLTTLGIGALGVAAAFGAFNDKDNAAAKGISDLSSEIYTLNKRVNELTEVTKKFDEIDNQVLKTNADLKEMDSLLSGAADKLTEDQRKVYEGLKTNSEKKNYLKSVLEETEREEEKTRRELLDRVNHLNSGQKEKFFHSTDDQWVTDRDSVYGINNAALYKSVNDLTDLTDAEKTSMKTLGQQILENVSAEKALELANNGLSDSFVKAISTIKIKAKDLSGDIKNTFAAQVLTSDDYALSERVAAYEKIAAALSGEELTSFLKAYNEYDVFKSLSKDTLDFIDNIGLSTSEINDLWKAIKKLGGSTEQLKTFLSTLTSTSGDITQAIHATFGELSKDDFASLFNAYANAVEVSVLDMGQSIDSFSNKISGFYQTAAKWHSMSNSDKTEFLSDNMDLFSGESGKELLEAFEGGNYDTIMNALKNDKALDKLRQKELENIKKDLLIAEQREGTDDYNAAWVKQLKEWQAQLEDVNNVYQVSLETRLKQEQDALNEYKSYLQEQQDAQEKSLNKRKDAYQKYFDAINKKKEDEEYDDKENLLVSNYSKLGSTTNASANSQRADLEDKLEELEKERLDTLRERAQEEVISNIDDQLSEIGDKFDKLLDNNRMMLAAMTGELDSKPSDLLANMISAKVMNGMTATELSDSVQAMSSIYGYTLGGIDLSKLEFTHSGNSLYLNVNGQTYELNTSDQQSLYNTIMAALQQLGLK